MSSFDQAVTRRSLLKNSAIQHSKSAEDVVNRPKKGVMFTSRDRIYLIPHNDELDCQHLWWNPIELERFRIEASVDIQLLIERHNLDYEMITHSGCMLSLLFIMKSQLDSDLEATNAPIVKSKTLTEFSVFAEEFDGSEHHVINEYEHMNELQNIHDDLDMVSVI